MNVNRSLIYLSLAIIMVMTATTAQAESTNAEDKESFNMAGYIFLAVAGFGWLFFLTLLGSAIYLIAKKSRQLYEPKHPVRCK
ncbi:MAG TPA: hypothetical protein D7H99_03005 [Candidatus Poseidoniales archaeon]|nr:MAG TPA: hypothetical protein D7H99_03005 [Candidatus Poseidoniales archaeon]HII57902.1 hypothetical protein [Candidatus Poseidoniaceae archaeon]